MIQLYKKDKKGNILAWIITIVAGGLAVTYGRYLGKHQEERIPIIPKGGRSYSEQADLQFESLISKQRDKGYKSLVDLGYLIQVHEEGDDLHTSTRENSPRYGTFLDFLKGELPDENTDAQGRPKPMKCTALQDTKTNGIKESVFKKIKFPCLVQPKLDGVRCLIMWYDDRWVAISSSGKSYNVAARKILNQIESSDISRDFILDGELYIHGEPLEYLSGLARKQSPVKEQEELEFHLFDIIDKQQANQRQVAINTLVSIYFPESKYIKLVPYSIGTDKLNLEAHYCNYTEDGYEGIIIRNERGLYKQGVRSSDIFKWKAFQDAEYEIIGIELGKRGSEDMVFVLRAVTGETFRAKPLGTRERKEKYAKDFHDDMSNPLGKQKLNGKMATVQFLTLSQNNIPQGNPRVKAIRDYE